MCIACTIETFKDPFNALLSMCGTIQANATCGNNTIYLKALNESVSIDISSLDFGKSCSYRFVSNCGYPKIKINQTGIDAVVASLPNSTLWNPFNANFNFDQAMTETLAAVNGALEYTYAQGDVSFNESCGVNRTIFVTVTNVNQSPASTSRLLAATNNIGITFSATTGFAKLLTCGLAFFASLGLLLA